MSITNKAIRNFHFPPKTGAYVTGLLDISGILAFLFPKSPCNVTVRSLPIANDKVYWVRNFAGRTYVESIYSRSSNLNTDLSPTIPLHDVESVFPFSFYLDWDIQTKNDTISPKHYKTTMFGFLNIPRWLMSFDLNLTPLLSDNAGWTLNFSVMTFGQRIKALGYKGDIKVVNSMETNFVPGFHHLILYDGQCNLCNASVDFLMRFDSQGRFIFCSQEDESAHQILRDHEFEPPPPLERNGDGGSVILLTADGELIDRAHAPLNALKLLGFPWAIIGQLGLILPRAITDMVYDAVAVRRYALFGKQSTCRVPTVQERERFLHRAFKKLPQ